MGMSDAEYEKVVAEMKRSRAHLAVDDGAQKHTEIFIESLGWSALLTSVEPDPQGRERAKELSRRCRALSVNQVTEALANTAHQLAMQYRNTNHPGGVRHITSTRDKQGQQWQWMRETNTGLAVGDVVDGSLQWALPFRDIDISRDGRRWFHLFGSVCVQSLPTLIVRELR